jgi:NAD(P)-dependent dehydrogenase (short-subunit alcohol dehydrogenase family)
VKTVLITGASSGSGAAAVERFLANGWNVAATMRAPEIGALSQSDLLLETRLDVQEPDSIASAVERAVERFGGIDVVVNNAGCGQFGVFEAIPPEEVQRQLDVNLLGPMAVIRAVLPIMRSRSGGVIVNVSSGAGLYGLPMTSIYCACS